MFGAWGRPKINEDTINAIIDFLDDNQSIKRKFILRMMDRVTVINAVTDIFNDKENEISKTFTILADIIEKRLKKHLNEVIDQTIKDIDANKMIKVQTDKALQEHPQFKTIKELGSVLKESTAVNAEIRDWLKQSTVTNIIEHTQGAKK